MTAAWTSQTRGQPNVTPAGRFISTVTYWVPSPTGLIQLTPAQLAERIERECKLREDT